MGMMGAAMQTQAVQVGPREGEGPAHGPFRAGAGDRIHVPDVLDALPVADQLAPLGQVGAPATWRRPPAVKDAKLPHGPGASQCFFRVAEQKLRQRAVLPHDFRVRDAVVNLLQLFQRRLWPAGREVHFAEVVS